MPRVKDPIWDNFDPKPNPTGKYPIAKCKMCNWEHAGFPAHMRSHFATHKSTSASARNLQGKYSNIHNSEIRLA